MANPKRPRDANQLAKMIVDLSTGEIEEKPTKNSAAVELGRLGGLKGGRARADKLTNEQKSEIARRGAEAKWARYYAEKKVNED